MARSQKKQTREILEYVMKPQGPVLERFNRCRVKNSIIRGPLGSGKTTQTILKIFDLMCEQAPVKFRKHPNYNIRLSRWIACRNTYSELFSTTIKDWLEIHGDLGRFKNPSDQPPHQLLDFDLEDGTRVKAEMYFVAFDRPDDVKKAQGLQTTGIWLNEVKNLSKSVVDMLDLRVGRYPSNKEGATPTWHGMQGDTNAPDQDHWLYKLAEEEDLEDWAFYVQPGGLYKVGEHWVENPNAENLGNLRPMYYLKGAQGKTDDWIKVWLANEYGYVADGKPVHPFYVDSVHCQDLDFKPILDVPIILGFDFGRTPACAFLQRLPNYNRWVMFDEFTSEDISAASFAPELKKYIDSKYPGHSFRGWGDPSGDSKGQATDQTPFKILRANGIPALPTQSNETQLRRTALETPLKEMCMDGKPRFVILPACKMARRGLQGGFCYRRIQVGGEKYTEEPDKNKFSHICFVADTEINTGVGKVPIQHLRVGDYVNTPIGVKKVTKTGSRLASVGTLQIGNVSVRCTGDHPFYTSAGFVHADVLEYGMHIATKSLAWKIHWWLNHYEERQNIPYMNFKTAVTIIAKDIIKPHLANTYIKPFTNTILETYQKALTSITLTETKPTTQSETSSYLMPQSIKKSIGSRITGAVQKYQKTISKRHKPQQFIGERKIQKQHQKLEEKVQLARQALSMKEEQISNAITAVTITQGSFRNTEQTSVQKNVYRRTGDDLALMMLKKVVNFAAKCSSQTSTVKRKHAVNDVQRVYTISVSDAACFYANGLLVSNCEALEYAVQGEGEGRQALQQAQMNQQPAQIYQGFDVFD